MVPTHQLTKVQIEIHRWLAAPITDQLNNDRQIKEQRIAYGPDQQHSTDRGADKCTDWSTTLAPPTCQSTDAPTLRSIDHSEFLPLERLSAGDKDRSKTADECPDIQLTKYRLGPADGAHDYNQPTSQPAA
jgi:hypothetical protein